MSRKRWIQDPDTHELIPAEEYALRRAGAPKGIDVFSQADFKPFKSRIDGSVIDSHTKLKEHMRRHNVVLQDDFGPNGGEEYFNRRARERVNVWHTPQQKKARKEAIARAVERLTRS